VRGRDSPDHRRILSASDTAFRDLVKRRVERVVKHIHTLPGPRIRYFLRRRQPAQPSERRCSHRVPLDLNVAPAWSAARRLAVVLFFLGLFRVSSSADETIICLNGATEVF
jgi:hypothetical protein